MNTQDAWPASLTRSIAAQIKRARAERNLSAQQLSDACAKLGLEMPRSTLADLENGRRAHLSVAELLVLARALETSPLALIFPVGAEAEAEVLPGEIRPTFRAAQWAAGEAPFPGADDAAYLRDITADWLHASGSALAIYRQHDRAVTGEALAMARARRLAEQATAEADDGKRAALAGWAAAEHREAGRHRADAEGLRRRAGELGILPPGPD